MLRSRYLAAVSSEVIPAGSGIDPRWQHIARIRELFLVRAFLPPPSAGAC